MRALFTLLVCISAIALLQDSALAQPRTLTFANLQWYVRSHTGGPGGAFNLWSDSSQSAWVDSLGRLHLKLRQEEGIWRSVEVFTVRPTHCGQHWFWVQGPMEQLATNVRVGLFLYSDSGAELDIEFARWNETAACQNASFSIHPRAEIVDPCTPSSAYQPFHLLLGATYSAHLIDWQDSRVQFQSIEYLRQDPNTYIAAVQERVFRTREATIPSPEERMRIHINLWVNTSDGRPARDGKSEIIIVGVETPMNLSKTTTPLETASGFTRNLGMSHGPAGIAKVTRDEPPDTMANRSHETARRRSLYSPASAAERRVLDP